MDGKKIFPKYILILHKMFLVFVPVASGFVHPKSVLKSMRRKFKVSKISKMLLIMKITVMNIMMMMMIIMKKIQKMILMLKILIGSKCSI